MNANQKCGKWCGKCGEPAVWESIDIGSQAAFCDKDARVEPTFGQEDEEFKWYKIPDERQETERAVSLRGYNKTLEELAQGVHRLRFDVIEKFYGDTAVELFKQKKECANGGILEGYPFEMGLLLLQAAMNAQQQQMLFSKMRALSITKDEKE